MTDLTLTPGLRIHCIGIGGTGISAIARVLHERGFSVSGSDAGESKYALALQKDGVHVKTNGHSAAYVTHADLVLTSSAIPANNPELVEAQQRGIPVLKRNQFLPLLLQDSKTIAVSGSHGKTTTTSMIAHMLIHANLNPSVIVGSTIPTLNTNACAGDSDYFVIEADEYDYMFLGLYPTIAVVNNIEWDHPDIFETADIYHHAFQRFTDQIVMDGLLVISADDQGAKRLAPTVNRRQIGFGLFGLGETAGLKAVDSRPNSIGGSDFAVVANNKAIGLCQLRLPGEHNIRNALATIAVGRELGLEIDVILEALATFQGVGRRFQEKGRVGNVVVIDDYAHHPTEIQVTLAAARQQFPNHTIWAVWEPHTYSRTKLYVDEFIASFDSADKVVILDIFPSRETDSLGLSTPDLVAQMNHSDTTHQPTITDASTYILERIGSKDVVITLSAGRGNQVGTDILKMLGGAN